MWHVYKKQSYCTQSWNSLTKGNKVKLERVQRAATRYILNFPEINYVERLLKLNLLPLSIRRDIFDLKFFYKCLHNNASINVNNYVTFVQNHSINRSTRSASDPSLLTIPLCVTNTLKNCFFNRIVHSWNRLPLCIRNLDNINKFTRSLKKYCYTIVPGFNPECCCTLCQNCSCKITNEK